MPNPPAFLQANQLAVGISCPQCGEQGLAVVEKTSYPPETFCEIKLVTLPDSFYQRLAKRPPHRIETLCVKCGGVLAPRFYVQAVLRAASAAG